jgi:hypothetical protein
MGFCEEEKLLEGISKALKVPVVRLGMVPRDGPALARISAEFCTENGVFPVSLRDRTLMLAMIDPTLLSVADAAGSKAGARVQIAISSASEILSAIAKHYHGMAKAIDYKSNAPRQSVAMMNENTLELDDSAPPPPGSDGETASYWGSGPIKAPPGASTLLDELVGDARAVELTDDEQRRLESVRINQDKASAILRALEALLKEKGVT